MMFLLIDPYANQHLSMAEIRLVNKVAIALLRDHEDLDSSVLARAIGKAYRHGMQDHALKLHVERDLGLTNARPKSPLPA